MKKSYLSRAINRHLSRHGDGRAAGRFIRPKTTKYIAIQKKIVFLQIVYLYMGIFKKLFSRCKSTPDIDYSMKYLIVGLGNVGAEYEDTRHNAGFMVVDALAREAEVRWSLERRAYRTEMKVKGRTLILIKPTTYMNLSGEAVRYWLQTEKVPLENLLVVVDDIALPLGTLRMKKQGAAGGHNGLRSIESLLGNTNYCRLRIGVGNDFSRGHQIEYVLGAFTPEEHALLDTRIEKACEAVKCFATLGPDRAMNLYNG